MKGVDEAACSPRGPEILTTSQHVAVRELGSGPEPAAVFARIARRPGAFFLDSAAGPEGAARWSFLGAEPFLILECSERTVSEIVDGRASVTKARPFDALRAHLMSHRAARIDSPLPLVSGAVGFLGYDLKHEIEKLPCTAARDQRFPDMRFGFYGSLLAYDNAAKKWYATAHDVRQRGAAHLASALDSLERTFQTSSSLPARERRGEDQRCAGGFTCNMTRDEYLRSVERIKEYIAAGDIFQANFTRRLEAKLSGGPEDLYNRLRQKNPAPFAAYIDCGDGRAIASSSPERFIELRGRRIETRPIKGTRPRGDTPEEDAANAAELEASAKDGAELAMIVDLERNDIGRVADYGSVRVTERAALEAYATVFHLVATVEGTLAAHKDEVDLLKATFPGGSITGAPKVRAMEIIEELEPTARSVYTGAIGYIGFSGDMDLNIAIRTMLWDQGRVTYQVGGGIVADSEPEAEWEETEAKGRALAETITESNGFIE